MGRALCSAWLERQSHPCTISSQFVSMSHRICAIQFAMGDCMLLILDIMICLTAVSPWGRPVIPSYCLIAKSVDTDLKSSHAADDIMG